MKKNVLILFLVLLLAAKISYSEQGSFDVAVTVEAEEGAPPSGGGGGGGGAAPVVKPISFDIDKKLIISDLKISEAAGDTVKISNTGEGAIDIDVNIKNLKGVVFVSDDSLTLQPGESKTIDITTAIPSDFEAGIYYGKVVFKSGSVEKITNIIIEIESMAPLFDVGLEILPQYNLVFPGDEVMAQITIYSLGTEGKVDVVVDYSVKDIEGNLITAQQKTIAVETQASLIAYFDIPPTLKIGDYIIEAKVSYNGYVATATDLFKVVEKSTLLAPTNKFTLILFGFLSLILLSFIIFIVLSVMDLMHREVIKKPRAIREVIKQKKPKLPSAAQILKEVKEEKVEKPKTPEKIKIKPKITKEKLEKQLKILEESFNSSLISINAYNKDKKKIVNMLKKL